MRQCIDLEFGEIISEIGVIINQETTKKIDFLFELDRQEQDKLIKLNEVKKQETRGCIELLIRATQDSQGVEIGLLKAMNTDFITLIKDIKKTLLKENLWELDKKQSNGKIIYYLTPI